MHNFQHVCVKQISPTKLNQLVIYEEGLIFIKQMMTATQGLFKSSDFPLTESRILRVEKQLAFLRCCSEFS